MFETEMIIKMRDGSEQTIAYEDVKILARELSLDHGMIDGILIAGAAQEYFIVKTPSGTVKFPRSPQNDAAVIEFMFKRSPSFS